MPYRAPAVLNVYNWTGFYLGINGGGAWGDSDWNGLGVNNSPGGGLIGGTVGYNWQAIGSPFVFGVEGDAGWFGLSDSVSCGLLVCQTKSNWLGTVRGRVGYAWDRFMPYFTGGAAFGDIEANRAPFPGNSDTNTGWTIGGGVEGAIVGNWTAKVEYLYVDLGDTTCSAAACGTPTNIDLRANVLRAGLNFRF
jgi:outer membrane immunogenic protein